MEHGASMMANRLAGTMKIENVPRVVAPKRIRLSDLGREPFRLFFPAAMLAGLAGVSLWPLFLSEWIGFYPGQAHARIMTYGFFGGFILGFLGTAMPRMLSAEALGLRNVLSLFALYFLMVTVFAAGKVAAGDALFSGLILFFVVLMIARARRRKDMPPPGFVLVGMSFLCVMAASGLAIWRQFTPEINIFWITLERALAYQGFVLLPVLGVGPFILPRFFGMPSGHDLPESLEASRIWRKKAALAFGAGLLIVGSFFIEAAGWMDWAYGIRFATIAGYLFLEIPFRGAARRHPLSLSLRIGLALMPAGLFAIMLWPGFRTGLLHLTLMGGVAVITLTVATRVVFGHSENLPRLSDRNRWVIWAVGLLLLGVATRVSGDIWPKIMISHYYYAALLWTMAVLLWAWKLGPKFLQSDPEE
jgi:uncharacterized protein involved in response to NO